MATDRQLTDQGRERKQQLLDRAAELFSERGYANTRVVDICEAAGAAKGLFYWYFENKEALFAELVASMRLRLRKAQADAIDESADVLTQLAQGSDASLRFMAEHASYFALLEVETRDERLAKLMRQGQHVHTDDVRRRIRTGIESGDVRDEDPELLALAVAGIVSNFSNFHRSGRTALPLEDVAAFVRRAVVRLVAAHPERYERDLFVDADAVTSHTAAGKRTPSVVA